MTESQGYTRENIRGGRMGSLTVNDGQEQDERERKRQRDVSI